MSKENTVGHKEETITWTLCSERLPEEAGRYLVTVPINPIEGNTVEILRWALLSKYQTADHTDKWCWVTLNTRTDFNLYREVEYADEIVSWANIPSGYALYTEDWQIR